MSFGPSAVEREAQQYRQQFGAAIPGVMNQGMAWMNAGRGQLDTVNSDIRNYISGLGKDTFSMNMQNYLGDIMSGKIKAAQGAIANGQAFTANASQAKAFEMAMKGNSFAEKFGSDLGGLALQSKNMQTVADKLASTDQNPFAVLTKQAMEDAAFQNAQGRQQLQAQLAAQGLDATSGTGAAALAALQFNTNKQVADAARQNAVQGAQFQQQGMGMAGQLYGNIAQLDLQRASTASQLGLQGYQADLQNASRYDAISQANAQLATQAAMQNAQLQTQASLQNASNTTQANLQNAQMQNQLTLAGLQSGLQMQGQQAQSAAALYGLLSGNAAQVMGTGQQMWGTGYQAQQNYMANLNQAAQASAAGRGQMWGGLLQGALGLAGAAFGGPAAPAIMGALGNIFGGGGRQTAITPPVPTATYQQPVMIPMTQPTMSYSVPGMSQYGTARAYYQTP